MVKAGWAFGLSVAGTLVGVGTSFALLSWLPRPGLWHPSPELQPILCVVWIVAHTCLGWRIGSMIERVADPDDEE